MRDAHDTHCCIDHGCKYGDHDCPVANGIRKQCYLCEMCGLETEGYYGEPERTQQEQEDLIDAMWEQKHNPKVLTTLEKQVANVAHRYGRNKVIAILQELQEAGITPQTAIEVLQTMKGIK